MNSAPLKDVWCEEEEEDGPQGHAKERIDKVGASALEVGDKSNEALTNTEPDFRIGGAVCSVVVAIAANFDPP